MNLEFQPPARVRRIRFDPQDRVVIDDIDYAPFSSDEFVHELQRVNTPDLFESFTHAEIQQLAKEGRYKRFQKFYSRTKATLMKRGTVSVTELDPAQREKVFWRKDFCDRFLKLEERRQASRSDASMKPAIAAINAELLAMETARQAESGRCGNKVSVLTPPSPTQLRKWLRKYEAAGFEAGVLQDGYDRSGNRNPRLDEEVREILKDVAPSYADARKPDKALVYGRLVARIRERNIVRRAEGQTELPVPSIRALGREIEKLDAYFIYAGREGSEKAKKKFYMVREGLDVRLPLERIEIDEWKVSLHTLLQDAGAWSDLPPEIKKKAEKVRMWASVAIDCATRCVLAIKLTRTPSAESALATLQMAVSDKAAIAKAAGCATPWDQSGPPATVCTDTGTSFLNHEFRAAVNDLGAEMMYAPAGMPQMRARIERLFSTMHKQLIAQFDGRTFENPVAKGDYDSEERVTIDVEELNRMLIRYVVDVYHNNPHGGLGGETPRNAWIRLERDYGVPDAPDEDRLRHIFGTPLEAKIGREGIKLFGLLYYDEKLDQLYREVGNKPVLIRVNQANIGFISVRVSAGWLTVACKNEKADGVSARDWANANEQLRRTHAKAAAYTEDAVYDALNDIRNFAEQSIKRANLEPPVYSWEELLKLNNWFNVGAAMTRGVDRGGDFLDIENEPAAVLTPLAASEAVSAARSKKTIQPPVATDSTAQNDWFMED